MANVEKQFRLRPARWPLDTLDACIRDFQWRRAPGGGMDVLADDIPAMCAEVSTFSEAVWIACASKRRNGKMHSHQTKVKIDARREFGWRIIEDVGPLVDRLVVLGSFNTFHDSIAKVSPRGIGPLTLYDVATRIGAYLRLEPVDLYLHTGARMGWDAMFSVTRRHARTDRVPRKDWPVALRRLSADMAEDFLCTYRDALKGIYRDDQGWPV